jgi:hypothetical protein
MVSTNARRLRLIRRILLRFAEFKLVCKNAFHCLHSPLYSYVNKDYVRVLSEVITFELAHAESSSSRKQYSHSASGVIGRTLFVLSLWKAMHI